MLGSRGVDDVTAPRRHLMCQGGSATIHKGERSCRRLSRSGSIWRRMYSRCMELTAQDEPFCARRYGEGRCWSFLSQRPSCVVAMEACGGAHFWGREIGKLGHEVRLIPPAYVKPFVKRQKNDMADAEAICEAAMRPTMRFVRIRRLHPIEICGFRS